MFLCFECQVPMPLIERSQSQPILSLLRPLLHIVLLSSLVFCARTAASNPVTMHYIAYAPFVVHHADRPPTGVLADLVQTMLEDSGVELDYARLSTQRFYDRLEAGQIQLVFTAKDLLSTEHYLIDPEPTVTLSLSVFAMLDRKKAVPLPTMRGVRLGTVSGLRYNGILKTFDTRNNTLIEIDNHASAAALLARNEMDYLLTYERMLLAGLLPEDRARLHTHSVAQMPLHFAVNRSLPNAEALLAQAIKIRKERIDDAFLDRLFARYAR